MSVYSTITTTREKAIKALGKLIKNASNEELGDMLFIALKEQLYNFKII